MEKQVGNYLSIRYIGKNSPTHYLIESEYVIWMWSIIQANSGLEIDNTIWQSAVFILRLTKSETFLT